MAVANIPVAPRNHLTGYTDYHRYSYRFNFDYYTLFHEGGRFTNEGEPIEDGYEFEKRIYDVFEYVFNLNKPEEEQWNLDSVEVDHDAEYSEEEGGYEQGDWTLVITSPEGDTFTCKLSGGTGSNRVMLEITEIEYSDPDAFTEEELRDYERVFIRNLVTTVLKTVYDIDPEEFREMNPRLTYSQKGVIRRLAEGNTEGFFKKMPMNMIEKEIGPFLGGHKGSRSADRRRVRKTRKVKAGRKTRKGGRRGRKTTHKHL